MEILRQHQGPIDAIFVAIGGGGLIVGRRRLHQGGAARDQGHRRADERLRRDGAVGRRRRARRRSPTSACSPTAPRSSWSARRRSAWRASSSTTASSSTPTPPAPRSRTCSRTRAASSSRPARSASPAIKQYVARARARSGETFVAITCGANMNFDRLRFVAERAEVGEEREALFAVTIPEERGSFRRFCELIGPRARHRVQLPHRRRARSRTSSSASRPSTAANRRSSRATSTSHGFATLDLTDDELAKQHVRHMVGGRSAAGAATSGSTASCFPERPGALMRFLSSMPAGLEHQPVPLPQPGRRLRPHPGRHAGAAGRRGVAFASSSRPWPTRAPTRRTTRPTGCSSPDDEARRHRVCGPPGVGKLGAGGASAGPGSTCGRLRDRRLRHAEAAAAPPGAGSASSALTGQRRVRHAAEQLAPPAPPGWPTAFASIPTATAPTPDGGRHRRHGRAAPSGGRTPEFGGGSAGNSSRTLRAPCAGPSDAVRSPTDLQHEVAVESRADGEWLGRLAVDGDQRQAVADLGLRGARARRHHADQLEARRRFRRRLRQGRSARGAPNSRDRSPRDRDRVADGDRVRRHRRRAGARRRTQNTAVAATSDQITNADSLANMRRLSWNALRLRASER